MSTRYFDKDNIDAVEFSADNWERTSDPATGTRTYTATADGASATVKFRPPRGDQIHDPVKAGTTFTRNKDGSWSDKELK